MENKVSIKQSQNVSVKDFSRILEINADLNYIQLRARFFWGTFQVLGIAWPATYLFTKYTSCQLADYGK